MSLNSGYRLIGDPRIGVQKSRLTYFNTCTQFANGTITQPNAARTATTQTCSNPVWVQINSAQVNLPPAASRPATSATRTRRLETCRPANASI